MDLQLKSIQASHEILAVIGSGGMGKVYKVRNTLSDRIEAMKIVLTRFEENPEILDRFRREIKVLATLEHPNIAGMRTALQIDGQISIIMEFVDGLTLDKLMMNGRLDLTRILDTVRQVLLALAYAHSQGVLHRDIKPANVMVRRDGRVKLMDFGIARKDSDSSLTRTGQIMGSVHYMSPEQVEGKQPDVRSDLYSLGVMLYEMLTGTKPFDGESEFAILSSHLRHTPPPPIELAPDVPPGLNEIVVTALARDPDERFQSADAFLLALATWAL